MKQAGKIILSLALVIVFLIGCFFLITMGYAGLILHTYQVYTFREPVAQVTISELKRDELGEYADVKVKMIKSESSALTGGVLGRPSSEKLEVPEETFKLYGDTVYFGGPIIKFHDNLIFLNFKTIYKLGKIYGRYDFDNEREQNRPSEAIASYDLNGGFGEWKPLFDNYQAQNIMGSLYRSVIDTTEISAVGQLVSNQELKYTIYITNTGFLYKLEG